MRIRIIAPLYLLLCIALPAIGQVSGNINFINRVNYPDQSISIAPPQSSFNFSVKGLANVEADAYVAIFSVSQLGKTTAEVNKLMNERIDDALSKIKGNESIETYVDMISFVPQYEYEVVKKIFSKDTYNEIPAGFELKKNIHIKYDQPEMLDTILADMARAEIYDLVRVDYFSKELEAIKKKLRTKAHRLLQEKVEEYELLRSQPFDSAEKQISDGYKVVLPTERYESYQAFSSSSLNLKNPVNVKQTDKSTTLYYQPAVDKEFDFTLNPVVLEPLIQVMYEIRLKIIPNAKSTQTEPRAETYYLITPNGELRNLNIN